MAALDLRSQIRDFFAGLEAWVGALTVFEWALLALAVGALAYVVASIRAAMQLGPIDVAMIEREAGATAPALDLAVLTARLREGIFDVGFRPPPEVPSGAPASGLIAAIKESPVPQANWIASLIEVFPRPRPIAYRLTTTIAADGSTVSFWLCPVGSELPLLKTIPFGELPDLPKYLLQHVVEHVETIFPPWSRWTSQTALSNYLVGIQCTRDGNHPGAATAFSLAVPLEPENSILRLRDLNARELCATDPTTGSADARAETLRGYLDLVMLRPELVEARFRASTMAGVVADDYCANLLARPAIEARLGMSGPGVEPDLRRINRLGVRQARALLHPWFVLLIWHRPRYAAEPQGRERRRLGRTLRISSSCEFARRSRRRVEWEAQPAPLPGPPPGAIRLRRLRLWWYGFVVRVLADRSAADWKVYYNAACFFAINRDDERAYRSLNRALDRGGYEQLKTWMPRDPDLAVLSAVPHTQRWHHLVTRTPTGVNRRPRWSAREFPSILAVPVSAALLVAVIVAAIVAAVILPWGVVVAALAAAFVARTSWVVWRYLRRAQTLYDLQT